jgi:LuxR family transcriptional regulator, quorum-sensing system regulator BjaR1
VDDVAQVSAWRTALDFSETCSKLAEVETIADALGNAVRPLGLRYFAVTRDLFRRAAFPKAALAVHWPEGWYEHYTAAGFYAVDPVVRRNRRFGQPFRWTDVLPECHGDARALTVMKVAANEFQLRDGICIPLHNAHGVEGGISFGGEQVELGADSLAFVHLVSLFAAAQITRVLSKEQQSARVPLSHREREVLTWAAAGKTAAETAACMNVSVSTVDKQIAAAIAKLGCATKTQAVALALLEGHVAV